MPEQALPEGQELQAPQQKQRGFYVSYHYHLNLSLYHLAFNVSFTYCTLLQDTGLPNRSTLLHFRKVRGYTALLSV
ncbi:MAG: hypothetical protein ACLU6Y_16120 [Ruminococcus sp.]